MYISGVLTFTVIKQIYIKSSEALCVSIHNRCIQTVCVSDLHALCLVEGRAAIGVGHQGGA